MSSLAGRQFGSYQLLGLIARGGMGEVWRARHLRLAGREVAVKILPVTLAADPTFLHRFEREANSAAALNHPHILPIWDYGEQDSTPYIVMPLVTGGSLRERLHGQPLPAGELLGYLDPVARALDYAHGRGIVHRDVKPANVLLDESGQIYLADFGIAKVLQEETGALTRTGVGIGTPEYMAPEQAQGRADPRSDIYALAVIAYEGLAGRVPYRGNTPVETAIQHMTAPLPPLSRVNPAISPAVEAVVGRALAKSLDERPARAGAFVADLDLALRQDAATSPTTSLSATPATAATVVPPPVAATPALLAGPVAPPRPPAPADTPAPASHEVKPGSRRAVLAAVFALGLIAGVGLTLLVVLLRGGLGRPASAGSATGGAPTPTGVAAGAVAATATAQAAEVPFTFPVTNAVLAANYQKTLAQAQKSSPDTRPHSVQVICFNPQTAADCELRYNYYSKQADQTDDYRLSLSQAAPDQRAQAAAGGDYDRVVFIGLPWERNAGWSRLLRESYALLPSGFGRNGFEVSLYADAPSSNGGTYDWQVTYTDRETNAIKTFTLRGSTVKAED